MIRVNHCVTPFLALLQKSLNLEKVAQVCTSKEVVSPSPDGALRTFRKATSGGCDSEPTPYLILLVTQYRLVTHLGTALAASENEMGQNHAFFPVSSSHRRFTACGHPDNRVPNETAATLLIG
ncbi:predicted protein [Histoplasma capsulatum var. duboisii H88]|uniref:Predicted protein n=1 Tax=Ajellomyces capsulatus (strain H88) TaxID=544711 RepID=F0UET1_AJEC8|nr:predicted protein [Histoplasma capsulatum var. duboisii H88]